MYKTLKNKYQNNFKILRAIAVINIVNILMKMKVLKRIMNKMKMIKIIYRYLWKLRIRITKANNY